MDIRKLSMFSVSKNGADAKPQLALGNDLDAHANWKRLTETCKSNKDENTVSLKDTSANEAHSNVEENGNAVAIDVGVGIEQSGDVSNCASDLDEDDMDTRSTPTWVDEIWAPYGDKLTIYDDDEFEERLVEGEVKGSSHTDSNSFTIGNAQDHDTQMSREFERLAVGEVQRSSYSELNSFNIANVEDDTAEMEKCGYVGVGVAYGVQGVVTSQNNYKLHGRYKKKVELKSTHRYDKEHVAEIEKRLAKFAEMRLRMSQVEDGAEAPGGEMDDTGLEMTSDDDSETSSSCSEDDSSFDDDDDDDDDDDSDTDEESSGSEDDDEATNLQREEDEWELKKLEISRWVEDVNQKLFPHLVRSQPLDNDALGAARMPALEVPESTPPFAFIELGDDESVESQSKTDQGTHSNDSCSFQSSMKTCDEAQNGESGKRTAMKNADNSVEVKTEKVELQFSGTDNTVTTRKFECGGWSKAESSGADGLETTLEMSSTHEAAASDEPSPNIDTANLDISFDGSVRGRLEQAREELPQIDDPASGTGACYAPNNKKCITTQNVQNVSLTRKERFHPVVVENDGTITIQGKGCDDPHKTKCGENVAMIRKELFHPVVVEKDGTITIHEEGWRDQPEPRCGENASLTRNERFHPVVMEKDGTLAIREGGCGDGCKTKCGENISLTRSERFHPAAAVKKEDGVIIHEKGCGDPYVGGDGQNTTQETGLAHVAAANDDFWPDVNVVNLGHNVAGGRGRLGRGWAIFSAAARSLFQRCVPRCISDRD